MTTTLSTPDLAALLPSLELSLRAERKSPQTLKSYGDAVRKFLTFCQTTGRDPVLDGPTVTAFTIAMLDAGNEGATAGASRPARCARPARTRRTRPSPSATAATRPHCGSWWRPACASSSRGRRN